jgi:PPM family protein phosphatase
MLVAKDSPRAYVRFRSDGTVSKRLRGADARARFENEIQVLRFLEARRCDFVPRLICSDTESLEIIMSHCGAVVQHMRAEKLAELFASLESFGVRHEDRALRNVTYRASDGRFCVIDFELAAILDESDVNGDELRSLEQRLTELEQVIAAELEG